MPDQSPHMWVSGKTGPFVVAAVPPAQRIAAAELPAELLGRVAAESGDARLSAALDLRVLLLGHDLGSAAAALERLRALAQDDSARVAEAARGALAEARLHAVPDRLDFGVLGPDDPPPALAEVRLVGPPIAQVRHIANRTRWLTVESSAGGLRIGVDPAGLADGVGQRQGSVTLSSPLGSSEVHASVRTASRLGLGLDASQLLDRGASLSSPKALPVSGALFAVSCFLVESDWIGKTALSGLLFTLAELAVVCVAVLLLYRPRPAGRDLVIGGGLAAGAVNRALVSVTSSLHGGSGGGAAIFELAAALLFGVVLVLRFRPQLARLRGLRAASPTQRPVSAVPIAAALGLLVTAYVQMQSTDSYGLPVSGSVADGAGAISLLLWIAPIAVLCALSLLADPRSRPDPFLVAGAGAALLLPDLLFMVLTLASGQIGYLGNEVYNPGPGSGVGGLIVLRALLVFVLLASSFAGLRAAPKTVRENGA